ncbi:hypothetical protein BH10CYA1_BH10CYA1_62290 [soil metagenome]
MEVARSGVISPRLIVNDCATRSSDFQKSPSNVVISACGTLKTVQGELAHFSSDANLVREPSWADLHKTAWHSAQEGKLKLSTAIWLQALKLLEFAPYTDPRLEENLDCLVQTYQLLKNNSEAEHYCLRALEVKRVAHDNWDVRVANCLNELAGIYYSSGQLQKVEGPCLEAEQIYRKLQGLESASIGTVSNNLAYLYHAQKKPVQAQKRYLQAIRIKQQFLPEGHPDVTILIANYARLLSTMGFD